MDDFYDQVSTHLQLASWFGRNLDALVDALRGGCGPVDPDSCNFIFGNRGEMPRMHNSVRNLRYR